MVRTFVSCILKHGWFSKGRLVADLENQRKISALEGFRLLSCICHRGGKEFPATFKLIYKATKILLKYNTIYNMTLSWIPIVWEQQQCRPYLQEAMAMRSQLSSSYFQSTGSIWKWPQSSISFYHKTKNSRTDCSKKLFQKPFLHGILRQKHPSLDVLQKKKWFSDYRGTLLPNCSAPPHITVNICCPHWFLRHKVYLSRRAVIGCYWVKKSPLNAALPPSSKCSWRW